MSSTDSVRGPLNHDRRHFFRIRSAPRASQACLTCAASKTRCDNEPTCSRCRRKNIRCIRGVRLPNDLMGLNDVAYDEYAYDTPAYRPQIQHARSVWTKYKDAQTNTEEICASLTELLNLVNPEDTTEQSGARSQLEQVVNTTLTDLMSLPQNWDSGVSAQLFDIGSNMDWALNVPDYDGLSSPQMSPLRQTAQADQIILPPDNSLLACTVDLEDSTRAFLAFRQSIGRWNPDARHYRSIEEQEMSSGDIANPKVDMLGRSDPSISKELLTSLARDKLIAIALVTCEPGNVPAVISAFPPIDVLEQLINISLTAHKDQVEGYIHVPTFSKAECRPETLAAIVIDGAHKSQSRAVQKFGFGLGEILSHHLYQAAERDIFLTRDLEYLQAFCLSLNLALWSGIRYKMELSGSTVGALLNMLRAAGRYRRTSYGPIIPSAADDGDALDKKWRTWVEQESFKRMVYYIYIHCVQEGFMTSTAGSHISSSELSLPLPESRKLWLAQSATEWKEVHLRLPSDHLHKAPPSVLECVADPAKIVQLPEIYDTEFAQLVQVYSISTLVREFKHSQSIFSLKAANLSRETVIVDEIQEKRLMHILNTMRIGHETSKSSQSAVWNMVRELASMHLHTFCDQIEVLAGREGPEEAQAAYPILCSWFYSQSSRQAVWHAGQVLRHMRVIAPSSLHIFHAVACYHASLCLWIYGVFSKLDYDDIQSLAKARSSPSGTILLDGEETLGTQRWIASNVGTPVISKSSLDAGRSHGADNDRIPLDSVEEFMDILVKVILEKFQSSFCAVPLLVQNICHLIRTIAGIQQPYRISTAS